MEPCSVLVSATGKVKIVDFRWTQTVEKIGSVPVNKPTARDIEYCGMFIHTKCVLFRTSRNQTKNYPVQCTLCSKHLIML